MAGAGGVVVVRVKRRRGEEASDSITMRVRKRADTKEQAHGIQLRRVEFDPGNPTQIIKPPKNRADRRGRLVHKAGFDPRPTNLHRRGDIREELKAGHSRARLVRFAEARAKTDAAAAAAAAADAPAGASESDGDAAPGAKSGAGGSSDGDTAAAAAASAAAPPAAAAPGAGAVGAAAGDIRILDIVDLVAEDRAKSAGSKYSDITCNDTQLERVLMRLQIDEKTGFTMRDEPKMASQLRAGRGRPGRGKAGSAGGAGAAEGDGDDDDVCSNSIEDGDANVYDLYILPEHESLPDTGAEYWIEADGEELQADDDGDATDDSDDPDGKEVDYDDEEEEDSDGDGDDGDIGFAYRRGQRGEDGDDDGDGAYGYGAGPDGMPYGDYGDQYFDRDDDDDGMEY